MHGVAQNVFGLGAQNRELIVKSADTAIVSDTTPNDDPHLFFTGRANAVYRIFLMGRVTSPATADIYWEWSLPSGAVLRAVDPVNNTLPDQTGDFFSCNGGLQTGPVHFGLISFGATAGTAQFRWAQGFSDSGTTTLHKGSSLEVERVA